MICCSEIFFEFNSDYSRSELELLQFFYVVIKKCFSILSTEGDLEIKINANILIQNKC